MPSTPEKPARAAAGPHAATSHGRPGSPAVRTSRISPPSSASAAPGQSFATRKARSQPSRPLSNSNIVDGNKMMRSIDRPPPGDATSRRKPQLDPNVSKKRSAYFENEFAASNRDIDPAKARIEGEATVLAELKTNIKDEFSFITDLSYHLSNRYQRPIGSIAITLTHGSCMMFGGSFDPSYTLTIHALPSLVQPITNKRNALLIQRHIQETLGVMASRGYVRFVATPEENVAMGGKTVAAEIDELSKDTADEKPAVSGKTSKSGRRISMKSFSNFKSSSMADLTERVPTPPPSVSTETSRGITTIPELPPTPPEDGKVGGMVEQNPVKRASRRKSLRFALFGGKSSPTNEKRPKTSGTVA